MNTVKKSVIRTSLPFLLISATTMLSLSGCGPSPVEVCIAEKSSLWNTKAITKADNQPYWNAVKLCNDKYKE